VANAESIAVPRLAGLRAPTDREVLGSGIITLADAVVFPTPEGICAFYHAGIVFLPALGSDNVELLKDLATIVIPMVVSIKSPVEGYHVGEALEQALETEPPPFPAWLQQSLTHPAHTIIPYVEIVEATAHFAGGFFGPPDNLTVTQQRLDGARRARSFRIGGPRNLLLPIMEWRVASEVRTILTEHFRRPLAQALLPALTTDYQARYGADLKQHEQELWQDLERRVDEEMSKTPEADLRRGVRQTLAPILPDYAKVPGLAAQVPWLFEPA